MHVRPGIARRSRSHRHLDRVGISRDRTDGASRYVLLKSVKVNSAGTATVRFKVVTKGTRYHRARFLGDTVYGAAPIKSGIALLVR